MPEEGETMTLQEVAKLLQCTEETVIDKAGTGKLAAVKFGRSWVFLRSALMEGLHLTALSNLKLPATPPSALAPAATPVAYAVTVPRSKRANANKSRQRPLPDLPPADTWR